MHVLRVLTTNMVRFAGHLHGWRGQLEAEIQKVAATSSRGNHPLFSRTHHPTGSPTSAHGRIFGTMDEPANTSVVIADGASHPLDPRWIPYQRQVALVSSTLTALVLIGLAAIIVLVSALPAAPIMVVVLFAAVAHAVLRQWWPGLAYRYASYRLGERSLEIRRGVLWRSWIDVPRSRIQHSDVSQGPLERLHGLGTLSVYTAGTHHALVRLHGLDYNRALAIRDHLIQSDDDDVV